MKEKAPAASAIDAHIYKIFPNDLNARYTMFGGKVMAIADRLALVVAERHSGRVCVTACIDDVHFLGPAREGDTLVFRAMINRAWTSSMEIGVRVEAENSYKSETRHIVSALFTLVALDDDNQPCAVPPVLPQTETEQARYNAAERRRQSRLEQASA